MAAFGKRTEQLFTRVFSARGRARTPRRASSRTSASARFASPMLVAAAGGVAGFGHDAPRARSLRCHGSSSSPSSAASALIHLPLALLAFWDFHVLDRARAVAGAHRRRTCAAGTRRSASSTRSRRSRRSRTTTRRGRSPRSTKRGSPRGRGIGTPAACPGAGASPTTCRSGPPGTFLLVTGSNMSGKSTLLRAIGVNVVLAQAGGPVCARRRCDAAAGARSRACGCRTRSRRACRISWPRSGGWRSSWPRRERSRPDGLTAALPARRESSRAPTPRSARWRSAGSWRTCSSCRSSAPSRRTTSSSRRCDELRGALPGRALLRGRGTPDEEGVRLTFDYRLQAGRRHVAQCAQAAEDRRAGRRGCS